MGPFTCLAVFLALTFLRERKVGEKNMSKIMLIFKIMFLPDLNCNLIVIVESVLNFVRYFVEHYLNFNF